MCNYPQANCIDIASHPCWLNCDFFVLHANHMFYYCLQLHVDAVILLK